MAQIRVTEYQSVDLFGGRREKRHGQLEAAGEGIFYRKGPFPFTRGAQAQLCWRRSAAAAGGKAIIRKVTLRICLRFAPSLTISHALRRWQLHTDYTCML